MTASRDRDEEPIEKTKAFWQRYSPPPLADEDAREIRVNLLAFTRLLAEWAPSEEPQPQAVESHIS